MTESEQQNYLDDCQSAFVLFTERYADYPQTEAHARQMALELTAAGLQPTSADHLAVVWERIRPRVDAAPAAPATVSESSDPVEVEARRMLASGEVTVESVRSLRSEEFERMSHNLAFCKALELLPKPPRHFPQTRGEIVQQHIAEERASKNGIVLAPFDPATEVARSAREVSSGYANHREPAPQAEGGVQHWSGVSFGDRRAAIANPGRDIPLPKKINARDAEAQRKKDNEFMESQRDLHARASRVRAHRAKQ